MGRIKSMKNAAQTSQLARGTVVELTLLRQAVFASSDTASGKRTVKRFTVRSVLADGDVIMAPVVRGKVVRSYRWTPRTGVVTSGHPHGSLRYCASRAAIIH
jgi:hypothetical protein